VNRRSAGRLFEAQGPAIAKARSPMVARCVWPAPELESWTLNAADDARPRPTVDEPAQTPYRTRRVLFVVWRCNS